MNILEIYCEVEKVPRDWQAAHDVFCLVSSIQAHSSPLRANMNRLIFGPKAHTLDGFNGAYRKEWAEIMDADMKDEKMKISGELWLASEKYKNRPEGRRKRLAKGNGPAPPNGEWL